MIECIKNGIDIETTRNSDGWTALHYACSKGRMEIIQYLTQVCKINVEIHDTYGNTALHEASRYGHYQAVLYLAQICNINVEIQDKTR